MRHDVEQVVAVALDQKIEAPAAVYPALPDLPCFIVFLGSQRWVVQIVQQKRDLLAAFTGFLFS
jgi:hypothetical protein